MPPGRIKILELAEVAGTTGLVDKAIFFGRSNLLLDSYCSAGFVPGNVFATITENLAEMAAACDIVCREGFARLPNLKVRPQRDSF